MYIAKQHRQQGISLIELMIAIAIGLMLVAGITTLIANQSNTREELNKASRQIENGRYAVQVLFDDIQLAGYYGEFSEVGTPTVMPDPCNKTGLAAHQNALPVPIQGYAAPSSVPTALSSCLDDADHINDTDILVVRRADTGTPIATTAAVANQMYLQSGFSGASTANFSGVIGSGSDTSVFTLETKTGAAAPLRKYLTHIYYLSPCHIKAAGSSTCTAAADNGNPIPTLKRKELTVSGGATDFVEVPLAEGIENIHFEYGVDHTGPAGVVDGAPDCYVSDPGSADTTETALCPTTSATYLASAAAAHQKWGNVTAVRISLLARNTEKTPGYTDVKTYRLGNGDPFTATDTEYRRHVFSSLARATNVSGRREQ